MASEEDNPVFPEDDFDDNDNDNNSSSSLNGAAPFHHQPLSSDDTDDVIPHHSAAPPSAVAAPFPKKPPAVLDDSRRLFQRLWTDDDEIELLQGFLNYTTSRGTTFSGHHHDTAAFYDQIKDKFQLDFNKNQLVEKLRRLKKKYRTVLSKMSSGKEFAFKSPHDQATFDLSRKIWTDLSGSYRGGASGAVGVVEFDEDDKTHNPSSNLHSVTIASAIGGSAGGGFDVMMANSGIAGVGGGLAKLSTRKRPRTGKSEDRYIKNEGMMSNNNVAVNSPNSYVNNANVTQGLMEETVRNCLSPVLKDLINNAVHGSASGGVLIPGFKGVGAIALNAVPLSFSGVNVGDNVEGGGGMDEKWRKQQMLELEVYSKRLELVQDQIKLSLEELRSMGRVD